jgi:hypothetical protein
MTTEEWRLSKVAENRLRRVAKRQGYALHRSRARDPRSISHGLYRLEGHAAFQQAPDIWYSADEIARLLHEPLS